MLLPSRALASLAMLGLLGLGACTSGGSSARAPTSAPRTSSRSTSSLPPATQSSATTARAPSAVVTAPAGGPIPSGFQPSSFTAVSTTEWWLLGDAPCAQPPCTSIVRTTDGGATFVGLPAPAAGLVGGLNGGDNATGVSNLRFANPTDGFAYGPALWATHDGGAHWHQLAAAGHVVNLAAADGYVYAVIGTDLYRALPASDSWSKLGVVNLSGGLAVHRTDVIVEALTGPSSSPLRLLVSHDHGEHFLTYPSPDVGLGCSFDEPAAAVVWAICATGTQAAVTRSTDGGATFSPLQDNQLFVNSAKLGAASATDAVVTSYQATQLFLTSDGGRTLEAVTVPSPVAGGTWLYVGFTDAAHGVAIGSIGDSKTTALYRTSDGGHRWSAVTISA